MSLIYYKVHLGGGQHLLEGLKVHPILLYAASAASFEGCVFNIVYRGKKRTQKKKKKKSQWGVGKGRNLRRFPPFDFFFQGWASGATPRERNPGAKLVVNYIRYVTVTWMLGRKKEGTKKKGSI